MTKFSSNKASGYDCIPRELQIYAHKCLANPIANIFNDLLEYHEPLEIGRGVLILLQKPGKTVGPLTSLRPIVLLTVLRETLLLMVLSRITSKIDQFLSPARSAFRRSRSAADVCLCFDTCGCVPRHRCTVSPSRFSA